MFCVRYKFDEIKELLTDKIVDFLVIAETKIDQSFNDNLFQVEGFKMFRRDRNSNGGGLLIFINSDFPCSRKIDHESENLENISLEIHLNKSKWLIMGIYKPPSMQDNTFNEYFTTNLDKCTMNYDNILVIGDLNFNMLNETKCKTLNDLCDVFNLSQLVSKPTCYMKMSRTNVLMSIIYQQGSVIVTIYYQSL